MQDKSLWDDKCNPKGRIFLKAGSQNVEKLTMKSIFIENSAQLNYIKLNCNLK
jgi:hypothetical protein